MMPPSGASARPSGPSLACYNAASIDTTQNSCNLDPNPFLTPKHSPSNSLTASEFSAFSFENERERSAGALERDCASHLSEMGSQQGSRDMGRSDGNSYLGQDEPEPKPRQVRVARDMYAGELPPEYRRDENDQSVPREKVANTSPGSSPSSSPGSGTGSGYAKCSRCGAHRSASSGECRRCGKNRSRQPPSSYRAGAMASIDGALAQNAPVRGSHPEAKAAPAHKCTKCGKHRRSNTSANVVHVTSQSKGSLPTIQVSNLGLNPNEFNMTVEPPSATSERFADNELPKPPKPTVHPVAPSRPVEKVKRGNSISSLFRSLSRKSKRESEDVPRVPTQQAATTGESSRDNLVTIISNAVSPAESQYQKLDPNELSRDDRPGSPFSFVDKPKEEEAFELNDIRKSKLIDLRRDSWDQSDEKHLSVQVPSPDRPRYSRSQTTRTNEMRQQKLAAAAPNNDDVFLGVSDPRAPLTRFQSLRFGVNRATSQLGRSASQIGRATSLKRLESVKKVPQFWYKDLEIGEGQYNEGYVY